MGFANTVYVHCTQHIRTAGDAGEQRVVGYMRLNRMASLVGKVDIFDHHDIEQSQWTTLLRHALSQFQQYCLSKQTP